MSEPAHSSKPQDEQREQTAGPIASPAGGKAEQTSALDAAHRYSVQGLIAILKDKSYCSLAAPPCAEPFEEGQRRATSNHLQPEQEP
jgi:hypothetical protein